MIRLLFHDGRQKVLCQELPAHSLVALANACTYDCPITVESEIEEIVEINGLMGSVEIADSDMKDACLELTPIITGNGNSLGERRQSGLRQSGAHMQ
jgi:hypothetical protein